MWTVPGVCSLADFGGSPDKTPAENRAALQTAITVCDAMGGGIVFVPRGVDYGWVASDASTHPSFIGVVHDMMVVDTSNSRAAIGAPGKQGWHTKLWKHTPQTTPAGEHDGNGFRFIADWHPYIWGDVSGNYVPYENGAGGRGDDYNYRVSYFTGQNGAPIWQMMQGLQNGNLPDEDLLDFGIIGWKNGEGVLYPLVVKYSDGSAVYGLGTSDPQAAHHWHQPSSANGKPTTKVSNDGTVPLVQFLQHGTSYDPTRDVAWVLDANNFTLEFPNLGNVIQANRATRAILTGGDFTVSGALAKTSGTFDIPHPDPAKAETHRLRHSFVESPTRGDNIYRFTVEVRGDAAITLPDYWHHLNEDPQVWVSPVDHFGTAYGAVEGGTLRVIANSPGTYNVLLIGTRKDADAKKGWDGKGLEYSVNDQV